MKRNSILIGLLAIPVAALIASCSPTPQKKAESLIKVAVQKTLVLPNSYQPVETLLDSAFSPRHNPEFIELALDVCKKSNEMERLDSKMKSAKSSMAIWGGSYMSAFARQQYNNAKEEYDSVKKQYDKLTSQIENNLKKMGEISEKGNDFIGFKAHHTYRAKNNAGNVLLGEEYFLLDKDITQIVAHWSKDEVDLYNQFIEMVKEHFDATEE